MVGQEEREEGEEASSAVYCLEKRRETNSCWPQRVKRRGENLWSRLIIVERTRLATSQSMGSRVLSSGYLVEIRTRLSSLPQEFTGRKGVTCLQLPLGG